MTRYWDGTYYGEDTYGETPRAVTWYLDMDWDLDGTLDEQNHDARRMVELYARQGRRSLLNASGNGFMPPEVGVLQVKLRDPDGLYANAWYLVGAVMQLSYINESEETPTITPFFTGRVWAIEPIDNVNDPQVRITFIDGMQWFKDTPDSTYAARGAAGQGLYEITQTLCTDYPWGFDGIPNPDNSYNPPYPNGMDPTIEPVSMATIGQSSYLTIFDLINRYGGYFSILGDGTAWFEHLKAPLTLTKTISYDELTSSQGLRRTMPLENIRNRIAILSDKNWQTADTSTVWNMTSDGQFPVAAGETLVFDAEHSFGYDKCIANDTPYVSQYSAYENSNSTGVNLTAYFVITVSPIDGMKSRVTVENTSATDGWLCTLMLREGQTLLNTPGQVLSKEDATSIARYGVREMRIRTPFYCLTYIGSYGNSPLIRAANLLAKLKDPAAVPTVTVMNADGADATKYLAIRAFDLVGLTDLPVGSDLTLRAGFIEHRSIDEICAIVRTTITFEPNMGEGTIS